ncbi:MAG: diaminopimelate decarboxylase [Deltaproteobacteria bacterium]|nr:MAG: diaminopimelate decarboxylase [Deltaproteobacteria bacterium]
MPIPEPFRNRLLPRLEAIAEHYGTPFYIYDEAGIKQTGAELKNAFTGIKKFQEFFAVKALPNPVILGIMRDMGFGFDCSSIPELILSRRAGAGPDEIMFTSNNTSHEEFLFAQKDGGCILNLDDLSLIGKVPEMPETICFRYNPGAKRDGNYIIGKPEEAKYGVSDQQIFRAYQLARERGAKRFGLHTMLASNELNYKYMVQTADMLLGLAEKLHDRLGIITRFINIGGGLGIPYQPEEQPLELAAMGKEISEHFAAFMERNGHLPALFMESGRFMTGPHGVLITRAINRKEIYRTHIGVDASMSSLMRPALYGSYHHIEVFPERKVAGERVDIVGSLCENNDKFAIQRLMPKIKDGDLLIIQDTGAHGHAMGFTYNGRLRPKELLLKADGSVEMIRRAENLDDYFATLNFAADNLLLGK